MDTHEIAQLCESIEAEACVSMTGGAPAAFVAEYGLSARRFGDVAALSCAGIGFTILNRVIGLGIRHPATEALIDQIIDSYAEAGAAKFAFQICPTAQPGELASWLEARGFTPSDDWVQVYRSSAPPDPVATDLRVVEVSAQQRDVFAQTLCLAYGMPLFMAPFMAGIVGLPGWRAYLAYDGEQPVTTGVLYVGDGVGWLGAGATIEAYRRRGGQSAVMTRRIQDGIALGCRWLVTETGAELPDRPNPSFHNMLRTGFQVGYLRRNYFSPVV